jgi:sterol desaturase/sphingolipid hydroxylase (fatty acid hydroxylase superfamily)
MEFLDSLPRQLVGFAVDIFRLSIWFFLLLAIFTPLEKLFAPKKHKLFRRAFPADVGFYFLNNLLPKALLVIPLAGLAWLARMIVPASVLSLSGQLPLWGRAAAAMVAGEFGYYWGHRWMHEIPFLWRFHSIHHNAEEMDWLVSTHTHPLDVVFGRLCGFIPMYALGLAQPMVGHRVDTVPLLFMLVGSLWAYFVHANVKLSFGWLNVLVSTPAFHHWHHTRNDHINKNYASILPIMDILFGSWYMPKKWPEQYGIDSPVEPGLTGQLLQPFLPVEEPAVRPIVVEPALVPSIEAVALPAAEPAADLRG